MVGLIGTKVGMTQLFDEFGNLIPVTAIRVEPNLVVGQRTPDEHGYQAVVLGSLAIKKGKVKRPYGGQFPEGADSRRVLREFRGFESDVEVGSTVGLEILEGVEFVDVQGLSKGKGFQGVMKRHGFSGGGKTHGSKFHRAHGSTGMSAWPSRVIKGTKMAGRMGGVTRTSQSLRLIRVDAERQVILVKGAVPGRRDSVVIIREAKKK